MEDLFTTLRPQLEAGLDSGELLQECLENIELLLARSGSAFYRDVIAELAAGGHWREINDRFYTQLAFGTGGLRGRTIGRVVTQLEQGTPSPLGAPEHPCVGTNAMNYFNISRATQGLVAYAKAWRAERGEAGRPRLVLAHDTRHFSRAFAEFAAKVAVENGCDVSLCEGPRSTPELSFAVRQERAQIGVMITASHNPPHDNGFKAYFDDGAQVVEPHASNIISTVREIPGESYPPVPAGEQGEIRLLGEELDAAYVARLETLLLDPELVAAQKDALKIIFTPIHGTGAIISVPLLEKLGFRVECPAAQLEQDGRFPTVKSPNPENAEALAMGVALAGETGADLVIATDPDADRMGIAARNSAGELVLLTGNQIGSLMGWYRVTRMKELGILNLENLANTVLIKTYVTTDLQKVIAEENGVPCLETLTGFKYIGEKLRKYEERLAGKFGGNYRDLSEAETMRLRLEHSTFYVFGGEESYGYLAADFVRDKDGNAATLMLAEVAAFAKSRGETLVELLDGIFQTYGYFQENGHSIVLEGAEGAAQIAGLVKGYSENPPTRLGGLEVKRLRNFAAEDEHYYDREGDAVPKEKMLILDLEGGYKVAVRPSGTEPKIKYYLFGNRRPRVGKLSAEELAEAKQAVGATLKQLWAEIQADVDTRLSA